jgi:acetolactate synthase-1/2/3 large subunit
MKASDLMVRCLEREGIEFIFGVPDANMDRAPMLVLTGQGSTQRLHKESHQIMDVVKMFEPVTKWAETILHADTIPEIVRKAVRLARSEKPGAVLIELPEDVAEQDSDAQPMDPIRFRRPVASTEVITVAAQRIREARRPVIIAGNGCVRKRSSQHLRNLVQITNIGVLNTFMAKGAVDPDSSQCLYTIGLGSKDIGTCAIDAADLVIAIGFDMVEYHPQLWNPSGDKPIIHIDFVPAEIDRSFHPQIELIGDVAHSLEALVNEFAANPMPALDLQQQATTREDMQREFKEYCDDKTVGVIKPQKVLYDVEQVYGDDGLLLSDVGAHKMWIARHYHCRTPNGCLIPNGFCSMGFALPGAIAASLVDPERKIIGIAGDAGFLMNVQEMETAFRLNSNITMMVWEDKAYGLIAWKQWAHFGRHTDLSFTNPDWEKLASAFGWHYKFVDDSDALLGAIEQAADHRGPDLIVLPIDYTENQKLTERLGELTCPI